MTQLKVITLILSVNQCVFKGLVCLLLLPIKQLLNCCSESSVPVKSVCVNRISALEGISSKLIMLKRKITINQTEE